MKKSTYTCSKKLKSGEIKTYSYKYNYSERVTCECGCLVPKYNKSRHIKTKKHKKLVEQKNNLNKLT